MSNASRGGAFTTRVMALTEEHEGYWLLAVEGETLGGPRQMTTIEKEPEGFRRATHDKLITFPIGRTFATLALHGASKVMIRRLLEEPTADRQTKWSLSTDAERAALDMTPCSGGMKCSGCGEPFFTEGDFARHFTISDRRYKNLGSCPVEDKRKRESEAESIARATGSVAATSRVERRDPKTGELVIESDGSWER